MNTETPKPSQADTKRQGKTIGFLVILAPIIIILSYILPWLGTGISGQPHSVFSVSAYTANQLKPDDFSDYLAQHMVKDFTLDSIAAGYRLDDISLIRTVYDALIQHIESTCGAKNIQSKVEGIEKCRSRISSEYLATEKHTQDLINRYIEKEAEAIPKIIEDLVAQFGLINKIGEPKIITGEVNKLEAVLLFLKKHNETVLNQAHQEIDETKRLLTFLNTIGLNRITTNKIPKAEVVKKYLETLPQEKLSANDRQNILNDIEETNGFLVLLYDLGEKNIFENIITRKDALVELPARLDSSPQAHLERVNNQLNLILDEIEKTTLIAIVSEKVSLETIINNITTASQRKLNLTPPEAEELKQSASRIIESILLLIEEEASYEDKNLSRFLIANTIFPKEIIRLTANHQETQNKIIHFLLCYDLIKYYDLLYKVPVKDFLKGALPNYTRNRLFDEAAQRNSLKGVLPAYIRNRIYNVAIQQELARLNPEVAELGVVFDQIYNLGNENLNAGNLTQEATDAFLCKRVISVVKPPLAAKLNTFTSIYDTIQTYGKAKDLSGEKISGLIQNIFRQRLKQVVTQSFVEWTKEGKDFTPENMLKSVAKLIPVVPVGRQEESAFPKQVKSLFSCPGNVQKFQGTILGNEDSVLSKLISNPIKIQVEKILARASEKEGFANLIIKALKDKPFQDKLNAKITRTGKRYPVIYAAHNTIMKLYTNSAITALVTEITQKEGFIGKLKELTKTLPQAKDLREDELEKLTTSKLRQYHRALTYLDDCSQDISSIYQNLNAAKDTINQKITEKRLKNLLLPDDRGIISTFGFTKSIYGITKLLQESLVSLTYGTKDLKWVSLIPILGLILLIVFIIARLAGQTTENTVIFIAGGVALVILFIFAIKISSLSPRTLVHLGMGPMALFLGLVILLIAALFSLPQTTRRTQVTLLGGIMVCLGFFLPWTGINPNQLFSWQSGYNLMAANIKLPELWSVQTLYVFIFPLISILLIILALITRKSGPVIFILALLSIGFFSGFVFCIPQVTSLWASGILVVGAGFALMLTSTAIKT